MTEFRIGQPPRGFRDRDRGGMRGRGPAMGGRSPMGHRDDPDWLYEPTHPMVTPMPGMKWAMGGNPMKWQQVPDDGKAPPVATTPVVATKSGLFDGIDPEVKTLVVTGAIAMLKGLFDKVTAEKPDATRATVELMTALRPPPTDAAEIKRIELAAEEKRETREAAAREAAARAAAEQRAHELRMASEQRAAEAKAAEEKEERRLRHAREEEDRQIRWKQMGLIKADGPTPEQVEATVRARIEAESMRERLAALAAQKTPDAVAQLEAAKKLITSLGGKVGGDEDPGGPLALLLNSDAGAAMGATFINRLAPLLERLLSPSPEPTAQPPMQTQVHRMPTQEEINAMADARARAEFNRLEAQRQAQLAAAQPPSMMDWQPIAADPAEQPAPAPEPAPEAPVAPVEEQPAPDPAPVTEAPAEPVAEPIAEPAPEAPTVVTEVPAEVETPAEPEPSEPVREDVVDG